MGVSELTKYRKPVPKWIREILEGDRGTRCEACMSVDYDDIHHKDGDPANNDFENLMLLCAKCHRSGNHDSHPYESEVRHTLWLDSMRLNSKNLVRINVGQLEMLRDLSKELEEYAGSKSLSREKAIVKLIEKGLFQEMLENWK